MRKKLFLQIILGSVLLMNTSCSNDSTITNDDPPKPSLGAYENGIVIGNEGTWSDMNASVDFISSDFKKFTSNIYTTVNNEELGQVLIGVHFKDDLAYLVLNSSNVVKIVNRYTFKKVGEIKNAINSPRHVAFSDKYIYVTNDTSFDGSKYVSIYNRSNLSLVKKIDLSEGAEGIVIANGNIFVSNSLLPSKRKTISYINGNTNTLQSIITVPYEGIQDIISDNNKVYSICSNYRLADSYIYIISDAGILTKTITLKGIKNASDLRIYNGRFYFTAGPQIYSMDMNADNGPSAPLLSTSLNNRDGFFTGFNIIDDKIITAESDQYENTSTVHVYNLAGIPIKTFTTGRGTSGLYKN